jgi:hypothetical protein
MFVAVAKVTLAIPDSGSLKSKRHVVHKVLDKVKARFNVSIAEVEDNDLWQKATLGIAAVANEHAFAQESVSKVLKYIEDLYVAPMIACSTEVVPMGGDLYGGDELDSVRGAVGRGTRTLAEAESEAAREAGREVEAAAPRRGRGDPRGRPGPRPASKGRPPMSSSDRERAIEELRQRLRAARRDAGQDGDDEH